MATIPSKMRVLLVEDEPIMRKFMVDLPCQIGIHQIHEASDVKTALAEAIKFQPDRVLSDIYLEPKDGIEFVKKLRALPNRYFANVPVIMMTADKTKETMTAAPPLRIKDYMIKPPTLEAMRAKIKATVN